MQNNITSQLLKLKQDIENSKEEKAKIQGELIGLMSRLEKEFQINSMPEAKKLLEEMKTNVEKQETNLDTLIEKLQEY